MINTMNVIMMIRRLSTRDACNTMRLDAWSKMRWLRLAGWVSPRDVWNKMRWDAWNKMIWVSLARAWKNGVWHGTRFRQLNHLVVRHWRNARMCRQGLMFADATGTETCHAIKTLMHKGGLGEGHSSGQGIHHGFPVCSLLTGKTLASRDVHVISPNVRVDVWRS